MLISHIVAVGRGGVIGVDNSLPWRVEGELSRFKRLTMGRVVIMGRKTYDSLPKKLEGRRVIVLSKRAKTIEGAVVAHSLSEALMHCKGEPEVFIVGGASVYKDTISLVDKVYYTDVDSSQSGDTFYPVNALTDFRCVFSQRHQTNYTYVYKTYTRKMHKKAPCFLSVQLLL